MGIYLDHSNAEEPSPDLRQNAVQARGTPQMAPTAANLSAPPQSSAAKASRPHLIQIIESEIIPRLFLAHCDHVPHALRGPSGQAGELGNSEFLADLFVGGDTMDIVRRIQALLDRGMRRERIYLDLLAPVPKTLSKFWADGHYSFENIATGLRCIDEVLQELHAREHRATGSN
jgi:hypothetical protein